MRSSRQCRHEAITRFGVESLNFALVALITADVTAQGKDLVIDFGMSSRVRPDMDSRPLVEGLIRKLREMADTLEARLRLQVKQ